MDLNDVQYVQNKIDEENKLNADLLDTSTSTQKTVTTDQIGIWNNKQDGESSGVTVFNANGSITETTTAFTNTTVFNANGSITETKVYTSGTTVRKTVVFNANGSITTIIEEVE